MKKLILFLSVNLLFIAAAEATCTFRRGATVTLPGTFGKYTAAQPKMYECNANGVKTAGGNRICIQVLSSVFASSPTYLHGAVLMLDRNSGEFLGRKRLHIGDPSTRPADAVNFEGDATALRSRICGWTPTGRNRRAGLQARAAELCSEGDSEASRARRARAGTYDLFEFRNTWRSSNPNQHPCPQSGNIIEDSNRQHYCPLSTARSNRMADFLNGFLPLERCPDRRGLYRYVGDREVGCYQNLATNTGGASEPFKRVSTISTVYGYSNSSNGSAGTMALAFDIVEKARDLMGSRCFPQRATQRSTYGSSEIRRRFRNNTDVGAQ